MRSPLLIIAEEFKISVNSYFCTSLYFFATINFHLCISFKFWLRRLTVVNEKLFNYLLLNDIKFTMLSIIFASKLYFKSKESLPVGKISKNPCPNTHTCFQHHCYRHNRLLVSQNFTTRRSFASSQLFGIVLAA